MKFEFTHFGYIDKGVIELADFTIICGPNNVGKTYISYATYGFFKNFQRLTELHLEKLQMEELKENGAMQVDLLAFSERIQSCFNSAGEKFTKNLEAFFNAPDDYFSNTKIEFTCADFTPDFSPLFKKTINFGNQEILRFNKNENDNKLDIALQTSSGSRIPPSILSDIIAEQVAWCLFAGQLPAPFVITSERTGISLFYKELDISKNAILAHISDNDKVNPITLLNSMRSRYAEPIKDNIDIVRDYENVSKRKSFLREDKQKYQGIFDALQELLGGSFKSVDKQVFYQPKKERGREKVIVPVYIASSSIKSLFLFDYYINCLAEEGGLLIIDEPELNLHPDNQRRMAALLARLVNAGIKVIVTTHSDYLIREINNRIMLNNDISNKAEIMKKQGVIKDDILRPEQVAAYNLGSSHTINRVKVDQYGIDMTIFDELIADANQAADDIYYNIKE
ncbi:MAG: ATP-binding protein [Methylococcales bacterium]|nr:ATP-binding protein [Methylococcales bacterium]